MQKHTDTNTVAQRVIHFCLLQTNLVNDPSPTDFHLFIVFFLFQKSKTNYSSVGNFIIKYHWPLSSTFVLLLLLTMDEHGSELKMARIAKYSRHHNSNRVTLEMEVNCEQHKIKKKKKWYVRCVTGEQHTHCAIRIRTNYSILNFSISSFVGHLHRIRRQHTTGTQYLQTEFFDWISWPKQKTKMETICVDINFNIRNSFVFFFCIFVTHPVDLQCTLNDCVFAFRAFIIRHWSSLHYLLPRAVNCW